MFIINYNLILLLLFNIVNFYILFEMFYLYIYVNLYVLTFRSQ